jgi:hypothetical protein
MVDYCLKQNIIQATNMNHLIKASLILEASHYSDFIDYAYGNLGDYLKQLAVNGVLGSFKPEPRAVWKSLCITRSANDAYNKLLALNGSFIELRNINKQRFYQVDSKYMTETDETKTVSITTY